MEFLKKVIQNSIVRKYVGNALVLCVAILIGLFIVEGVLRTLYVRDGLQNHIELYTHSCYAKSRPPNISDRYILKRADTDVLFETNTRGFRDVEHAVEKPSDTYRIVFVGDSMVEAREVEFQERFDQLVQELLRSKGVNVEVITFAVASNNPVVYAKTLDCLGYTYNPDLIVVNYFPHNDFEDFTHISDEAHKNNFRTSREIVYQPHDENALFIKINNALFNDKESRLLMFLQDLYERNKQVDNGSQIRTFMPIYYGVTTDAYASAVWESNMRIFESMFMQAHTRGVQMLWVNLGMGELVETMEGSFSIAGQTYEQSVRAYPIHREKKLANEFGVHYLYLFDALHADYVQHGAGLYAEGVRGKHYSPRGHTVVAETLTDYIITNILGTKNTHE